MTMTMIREWCRQQERQKSLRIASLSIAACRFQEGENADWGQAVHVETA